LAEILHNVELSSLLGVIEIRSQYIRGHLHHSYCAICLHSDYSASTGL